MSLYAISADAICNGGDGFFGRFVLKMQVFGCKLLLCFFE